jgi:large subunit ribosomal protein L19
MISDKFSASGTEQNIHIGDTLRVHTKVQEGEKSRIQVFEGILIRLKGRDVNKTFTVRKIGAGGIGVERTWPLDSNSLVKIEVKKKTAGVRRSKLYYLRELTGKSAVRV